MKKVVFLITKSNWGGAQRYVYDLATNLDKEKFTAHVIVGGEGELINRLQNAHIPITRIESLGRDINIKKEWETYKQLWRILKIENPDVLHVNSSKARALGALIGRLQRTPRIIFTAHGWAFNEKRPWWQKLIIKFIHWITVLLSHRTIAVSSSIVRDMNWPFASKKMKCIHPGRSIGPMYTQKEAREKLLEFFPQLQPYKNDRWIVCVAELHPVKGHDILIEAFRTVIANHLQTRLVLIGNGQEKENLQQTIERGNLTESIFLLGNLSDAARFLPAFTISVLASYSEAYGYVIHESGLAGLPVVASKVGGIPDIINHKDNGELVPKGDSVALANSIDNLLNNKGYAKSLGKNLQQKMSDHTVGKMTKATEAIYEL